MLTSTLQVAILERTALMKATTSLASVNMVLLVISYSVKVSRPELTLCMKRAIFLLGKQRVVGFNHGPGKQLSCAAF